MGYRDKQQGIAFVYTPIKIQESKEETTPIQQIRKNLSTLEKLHKKLHKLLEDLNIKKLLVISLILLSSHTMADTNQVRNTAVSAAVSTLVYTGAGTYQLISWDASLPVW